jgi:hypothetical protein
MSGSLDDRTAFRLGGTAGNPVVGCRVTTATTGETAVGVSGNCRHGQLTIQMRCTRHGREPLGLRGQSRNPTQGQESQPLSR